MEMNNSAEGAPNTGPSRTAALPLETSVVFQKWCIIEKESRQSRRCR